MLLKISHTTHYTFDAPVPYGLQKLRLTPKSRAGQKVLSWSTQIDGGKIELSYSDHHNNQVDLVSATPGTREIKIVTSGEVETSDNAGIVGAQGGFVPLWMFLRQTPLTRPGKTISAIAKTIDMTNRLAGLHALSAAILAQVRYDTGEMDVTMTGEDAAARGHGVCQDHAHIFISAARRLGVPSRYVSGYLLMDDGQVQQAASHAWAEAHVDELGWVGFDISNGISPDGRYVRVATALDYAGAAPVSGLLFGDHSERLVVSVRVEQ
ncbi:MAG: transglutaminase family protein [Phyllobacteriaceae bacterium]|nr:transglutaminase family protein [Phyllobacteriaceae bacterium]